MLALNTDPVTIKQIEISIVEEAQAPVDRTRSGSESGRRGGGAAGPAAGLAGLNAAVAAWVGQAREGPLARWMDRELDPEGVPRRLPVAEWTAANGAPYTALRIPAGDQR